MKRNVDFGWRLTALSSVRLPVRGWPTCSGLWHDSVLLVCCGLVHQSSSSIVVIVFAFGTHGVGDEAGVLEFGVVVVVPQL